MMIWPLATLLVHTIWSISPSNAAPTDIPSAASFFVPHLPDLHQDEAHPLHIYAGHIESDPNQPAVPSKDVTAHLYFVLVKARRTADKERVMFWFNGGPGCSSFDGLMMENGPWRVDGKGGLKALEGGWEEYTHMVYIDQPAGTGLSYTSTNHYVHSLTEAADQILQFMRTWYKVFPEFAAMDTYFGGESYAGQYIPYFADKILKSNLNMPLRGVAIGNGWMDARRQYPAYLDYATKHGLLEENSNLYKAAKKRTDECNADMLKLTGEPVAVPNCEGLVREVLEGLDKTTAQGKTCTNIYDVRLTDTYPACGMNWPVDLVNITTYLGRKDVVRALHADAKSESWAECRGRVSGEFNGNAAPSAITLLPSILEKIPILLFAGDQDFICNYMGIESMIQAMTWGGATGLGTVKTEVFSVEENPVGTWVSSRNLTYVKLFNASHMAPYDVPYPTHDMILRFMGMNFSAITTGSARTPSRVGDGKAKPVFQDVSGATPSEGPASSTPEKDKAMWEAYYNAGSAALVFVLISLAMGLFIFCRVRRNRVQLLNGSQVGNEEEEIPLTSAIGAQGDEDEDVFRKRKGKERAMDEREASEEAIFDVGDSDDEEGYKSADDRRR
ncbi:alpha beta-hydrolase [Athelia psychrophila]|uniref:Pheromone-processing carboxypeptidase KEX1 n=1 Tax=Athelia psychrophila TaxID=1759441 RepID=A0A166K4X1_9AGAM|nr:alpha beta-hydrolase [Fibularhizoctonia sp. CBS 109695]